MSAGKRSSKQFLIAFVALAVMLLPSADMAAASHPEGGHGSGLFVRLELPWTTLMAGEIVTYHYILENASSKPVPVAFPYAKYGFGWLEGGQPFLETVPRFDTRDLLDVRRAQWPPKTVVGEDMEAWGELPPGQRVIWNQSRIQGSSYGVYGRENLEAIQAHWLVGPERWISSEPVSVKVVNVPGSLRKEVFEAKWSSYGYGKDLCQGLAYTVPIENRLFLFFRSRRVTEVEPDDEFAHTVDKHGTNLEITIKNNKGSRKVYYHLRQGLVGDTPWQIGPVSLFFPKPEPIPPVELEALRKKIPERDSPAVDDRRADRKQSPNSRPIKANENEQNKGKKVWIWLALLLFIGIVIFIVIRKVK